MFDFDSHKCKISLISYRSVVFPFYCPKQHKDASYEVAVISEKSDSTREITRNNDGLKWSEDETMDNSDDDVEEEEEEEEDDEDDVENDETNDDDDSKQHSSNDDTKKTIQKVVKVIKFTKTK